MTQIEKAIKPKLGLLELARQLGTWPLGGVRIAGPRMGLFSGQKGIARRFRFRLRHDSRQLHVSFVIALSPFGKELIWPSLRSGFSLVAVVSSRSGRRLRRWSWRR